MSSTQTTSSYALGLVTDKGRQRSHNEDAGAMFALGPEDMGFVVCDGMGGLRSGDIAANEAVRVVRETMEAKLGTGFNDPLRVLAEALQHANSAVYALSPVPSPEDPTVTHEQASASQAMSGTTCVAGVLQNQTLYIAHAGDSRAYKWRRGHLVRLTDDHSFVGEKVRSGDMTEAEARVSRFRNMVTRAIGIDATVQPDTRREPLEPGDLVLVCSDGLTTMLDDPAILALLNNPALRSSAPEKIAQTLVDAANKEGGSDNITVFIARIGGNGASGKEFVAVPSGGYDPPRSRKRQNAGGGGGVAAFLLGLLLGITLLTCLLAFYEPVRKQAVGLLGGKVKSGKPDANVTPPPLPRTEKGVDYTWLEYAYPTRFTKFLARGDILTYSPGTGLYFVTDSTGRVSYLSRTGVPLRTVENVEPASNDSRSVREATEVPAGLFYMTSDPQGNVYFSYPKRAVVVKKSPEGQVLRVIRGFIRPEAIAVDEVGNVYVVDNGDVKICRARPGKPKASPSPAPKTSGQAKK